MLNDIELRGAFYYPGCGMDLQPLLRFSHLTDLFIYADPQYDEWDVVREFTSILAEPPFAGRLEMIGPGRHVTEQELGRTAQLPAGMARQLREHEMERRRNFGEIGTLWAREFCFRRHIAGIHRDLRLIYVRGEGLATYSAFYAKPAVSPMFLCSIQTTWGGVNVPEALEAAGGIHEQFLRTFGGPKIWIRGNWIRPNRVRHPPVDEGHWNRRVQKYAGWQCFDYEHQPIFADVAAFTSPDEELNLDPETVINGVTGQSVHLVQKPLEIDELQQFEAAFISPRLYEWFQHHLVPDYPLHEHGDGSLPEVLDQIRGVAVEHGYQHVVMTGRGYEDEGEYFQQWIAEDDLPMHLEVRFEHDLDLADQRGWAFAE